MADNGQLTLSSLKQWERNPRTIAEDAFSGLGTSMERYGDLSGITWNRRLGALVCGHQRCKQLALQAGGDPPVQMLSEDQGVIVVNDKAWPVRIVDWDEKTHAAANVAANNWLIGGEFTEDLEPLLQEIAADDEELLKDLRLDELGKELSLDLFQDIDELEDVEAQVDRAEELQKEWNTSQNQVWVVQSSTWVRCPNCSKVQKRSN